MSDANVYENPLIGRYASKEMATLWGPATKAGLWRRLWAWLAESEAALGVPITQAQLNELWAKVDGCDLARAAEHERRLRHDVMAHVHTFGEDCPAARPIIHLGATSCYVTDNADLMLIKKSLEMVRSRLVGVIDRLATFARQYQHQACLGFTHLQPAQPTTVGKRTCLWIDDLVQDLYEVEHRLDHLRARGVKGTTGTQASFLELLHGDHEKVRRLDQMVAEKMGFESSYLVTGQTYSRKVDLQILDTLAGIAASAHKAATDLRLLQSRKEIEEPFETEQIGSSAMAYKRNPMRAERICALGRFVTSLQSSAAATLSTQWLERTLDDSANRRLVIPQAFLAVDAILLLYVNIAEGLVVYPQMIARHLNEELPFMATEEILMKAVELGGDRQDLHERIRRHSQDAAREVKENGKPNDLLVRLAADSAFQGVDLTSTLDPNRFVGRAPEQVDDYLGAVVSAIRVRYPHDLAQVAEIRV